MKKFPVHFAPSLIQKIETSSAPNWADALHDWHYLGDPEKNFGRDVSNARDSTNTWAWHVHMAPEDQNAIEKWDRINLAFRRTSDRLLVYSMDKQVPERYGILLLAFLTPNGHDQLIRGASAAQRRSDWEDIAYTHQYTGNMPQGTFSFK